MLANNGKQRVMIVDDKKNGGSSWHSESGEEQWLTMVDID